MTMRKAKIVCTIGPASHSPAVLDRLIENGMNAARLNFSHGTHDSHAQAISAIRQAAAQHGTAIAILQDLQGPRIRVGVVPKDGIEVKAGQIVRLRTSTALPSQQSTLPSSPPEIPVTYPLLTQDLHQGARVLINDGLIELVADRISDGIVDCSVLTGGTITSHKGINLPGTTVSVPTLTDKDREDIRFGVKHGVDYLALSFVRGPQDITTVRAILEECGASIPIIAKIERAEAITTLHAILDQADGVMIARGDLGVEMGPERVPILQKRIIAEANRRRRLVITATQMLESMTHATRPTRAEASDVANAIFDGTDAVMLSAETASGTYPIETVQVMDRIVRAAEAECGLGMHRTRQTDLDDLSIPEAICVAASSAARAISASAIVAFTEQGPTARLLSKQRPGAPILALTVNESVRQRTALYWGVQALMMPEVEHTDVRLEEAERLLKMATLVRTGDRVVLVSGTSAARPGGTNLIKLHEVS
jgi:pyruvate kinase